MAYSFSSRVVALFVLVLVAAASNVTTNTSATGGNASIDVASEGNTTADSSNNTNSSVDDNVSITSGSYRFSPLRALVFVVLLLVASASNATNTSTTGGNASIDVAGEGNTTADSSNNTNSRVGDNVSITSGSYRISSSLMATAVGISGVIGTMAK